MPNEQDLPPSQSAQNATNVLEVLKGLIPDYLQQSKEPTTMVPNAAGKVPQLEPYSPLEQAAYGAADVAGMVGPAAGAKAIGASLLGMGAKGFGRKAVQEAAYETAPGVFAAKSGFDKAGPIFGEIPGTDFIDVLHSGTHAPFAAIVKSNASGNYLLHHAGNTSVFDTLDKAKAHAKDIYKAEPRMAQDWKEIIANHDANKMHSEEFGSTPIIPLKKPNEYIGQWDLNTVPREAQWQVPEKGKQLGFNVPTHHATRTPVDFNKFRLPELEVGAHFGSPRAALDRIGGHVDTGAARTYPVAIQANNPLELPDLGSWGPNKMISAMQDKGLLTAHDIYNIKRADYGKQMPMIRDVLKRHGHDSIVYKNSVEDPGSLSYILFNESQKQPGYVKGARAPWAAYHPEALDDPNILRGLAGVGAGGAALAGTHPDIQSLINSLSK